MKVHVELDGGLLADRFGKYAPEPDWLEGFPVRSFPIEINDVPQEARTLDALDGRAPEQGAEALVVESQEIAQAHSENSRPGQESALAGRLREAVPRAGLQAIVAAADAVAQQRAQCIRIGSRRAPAIAGGTQDGAEHVAGFHRRQLVGIAQ